MTRCCFKCFLFTGDIGIALLSVIQTQNNNSIYYMGRLLFSSYFTGAQNIHTSTYTSIKRCKISGAHIKAITIKILQIYT